MKPLLAFVLAACVHALACATPIDALRERHAELRAQLADNAFGQPIVLGSRESEGRVAGDVYAEFAHPLAAVATAFRSPDKVCEVLFLHLNVRACRASGAGLTLSVGPKRAFAGGAVYHMGYALRTEVDTPQYLRVVLQATSGPLSTSDYRVVIEAIPLDDTHVFVHCAYTYGVGMLGRMAMSVYLATAGRSKIGFTIVGQTADGKPVHVGGERGSLERNVMRYYLAVLAHTSVTGGTPEQQMEQRLRTWHQMTEAYAKQLHELTLAEYLEEKHRDLQRAAQTE